MIEFLRRPLFAAEDIAEEKAGDAAKEEHNDGDQRHLSEIGAETRIRISSLIVIQHGGQRGDKDTEALALLYNKDGEKVPVLISLYNTDDLRGALKVKLRLAVACAGYRTFSNRMAQMRAN